MMNSMTSAASMLASFSISILVIEKPTYTAEQIKLAI